MLNPLKHDYPSTVILGIHWTLFIYACTSLLSTHTVRFHFWHVPLLLLFFFASHSKFRSHLLKSMRHVERKFNLYGGAVNTVYERLNVSAQAIYICTTGNIMYLTCYKIMIELCCSCTFLVNEPKYSAQFEGCTEVNCFQLIIKPKFSKW